MRLSSPVPHKRARIEIIPLIDIMFFLLASFMMVSLSQTHMAIPDIKISISAAPMAMYGDVIGVLDKVRSVGITKVGYQIRAAAGPAAQAPPGAPAPPPPPKP